MVTCATSGALADALRAEIRRRVAARECTVSGLAARAAVSQPLVSNFLAGRRLLSFHAFDSVRLVLRLRWCDLAGCEGCAIRSMRGPCDIRRAA
jgi:hypothetical protein